MPNDSELQQTELHDLEAHFNRVGSDPAFEKEFADMSGVRVNRTTLRDAIGRKTRTREDVVVAIRAYLRTMRPYLLAVQHVNRYTGRLMFAATQPKTAERNSELGIERYANPDLLYRRMVPVTDFKKALLRSVDARGVSQESLKERGLCLPDRIAFVNHTGQWLKPVLRKLLKHPQSVNIEVYVCHPEKTHHHDGHAEWAEVLGVLEFLWSLPTSLDLATANPNSSLKVFTYNASQETRRLALFRGDLVARTPPLDHLDEKRRPHGHPGVEPGARCILAPSSVELALSGAPEFDAMNSDVEGCLAGGSDPLPDLDEKPRMQFAHGKFIGLMGDKQSGDEVFDIDPRRYLCKASLALDESIHVKKGLSGNQKTSGASRRK